MTPTELVAAFEAWSRKARTESEQALADDEIGKAARLLGKSQGLSLAAMEMRRHLDIDAVHFGEHGGWVTGDAVMTWTQAVVAEAAQKHAEDQRRWA